ncbi:MAG: hypothetical protein IIC36_06990, partial [Gemmatimonadetes bacterium]|nr:hypothetical protein [Gemmatimonadota bacterium]
DEQRVRDIEEASKAQEKLRLEQAPDKEKLMVFAQVLREVEQPKLESDAGELVMASIHGWLKVICSDIESEADRL